MQTGVRHNTGGRDGKGHRGMRGRVLHIYDRCHRMYDTVYGIVHGIYGNIYSNICNNIYKGAAHGGAVAGLLGLLMSLPALADGDAGGIRIVSPSLVRSGSAMNVGLEMEFPGLKVRSTGATVVVPMLVNGADTLRLPAVEIYGRTSWYASRRNDRIPLSGNGQLAMRYEKNLAPVSYSQRVEYADWMNGAELIVRREDYGCLACPGGRAETDALADYRIVEYKPTFIYQAAVADSVKTRELSGRAYVDFPVNRTEIFPDYRRNSLELAKIIATIDSVKNDEDVTVTSITIKGFASPEGSYANNTRLARGRTESLSSYVQRLYRFPAGFIKTDYEPEDWEGLREYVVGSSLPHRDEILLVIDDAFLDPDIKD